MAPVEPVETRVVCWTRYRALLEFIETNATGCTKCDAPLEFIMDSKPHSRRKIVNDRRLRRYPVSHALRAEHPLAALRSG